MLDLVRTVIHKCFLALFLIVLFLGCSNERGTPRIDSGISSFDSSIQRADSSINPQDSSCAFVDLLGSVQTPTILFVVDKSGSMEELFGTVMRWVAVRQALTGPSGVVTALEDQVRFGLLTYNRTNMCPATSIVMPSFSNRAEIDAALQTQRPYGDTPTGPALDFVNRNASAIFSFPAPHYVILVTDGYPDTCENGNDEVRGRLLSVEAVRSLLRNSVQTFVLSVGDAIGESHLQDIANAGTSTPPGRFFVANNPLELSSSLRALISQTQSCRVYLDGSIEEADICSGDVRIDGNPIICNSDFRWVNNSTIELLGDSCSRIQMGGRLTARFPCSVVLI